MNDFAIIGDEKYFETMKLNVSQIRRHHDAKIFIGDLGLTTDQKRWFFDEHCTVLSIPCMDLDYFKMLMKPLFLLQCMTHARDTVLLMDGDCVLMKPFDLSVIGDVMVTVRRSKHGRVNSGVVASDSPEFACEWAWMGMQMYLATRDRLSEQNALAHIAESSRYRVEEISCDVYNYPKVEKGIPDDVVICHLKSGRFQDKNAIETIKQTIKHHE